MNESVSTKQSSAKTAKSLTGLVVSDNMNKTVTVLIERKVKHPIYQKYIRRSNKFMAHDEENTCRKGDIVTITPCRPLSKNKSWQLQAIVRRPE